ncbi:MAG TPA: pyrimidine utilization protein A [Novosphingobium sp.]|nr:pyrimidine utilization protein A [Novosphingobium sp.]
MDLGVFIPIGNNGWLISQAAPQYRPSFELNRMVVQKAESYGLDFALSMIKLRGFGGATQFWDHNLESFTLMAGLAAVTQRIRLFASTPVLVLPPAMVARMASTIDSIAPGRFGINIVSGWAEAEYSQMGLWPGQAHYQDRYTYSAEYVQVMRDLWETGHSDFKGRYFQMEDCRLSPRPAARVPIVAAGQSGPGVGFAARHADYNFCMATGINQPTAHAAAIARLVEAAGQTGRDVGSYVLFMIIADESDEKAQAKWAAYQAGADTEALAWMGYQAGKDESADTASTARTIVLPEGAINTNMGTLIGSYATVARLLDEAADVPGTKGIMLCFDDYETMIDAFGQRIQPLMRSRAGREVLAQPG